MNPSRFVALHCSEEAQTLLARHPNAFLLLCQIAMRARWKDCPISKLKAGEAFIGDWKECGLRSEMAYRCAKKVLTKCHLVAFTGTNKGTRASLRNESIFSLTAISRNGPDNRLGNEPGNNPGTDEHRTSNDPVTTIHTEHKEHPDTPTQISERKPVPQAFSLLEEIDSKTDLPGIVALYPRRENVKEALEFLTASIRKGAEPETVMAGTRAIAAVIQQLPSGALNSYVPNAGTFFKNERWRDDPQTWRRNATTKNGAQMGKLDLGGRRASEVIRVRS